MYIFPFCIFLFWTDFNARIGAQQKDKASVGLNSFLLPYHLNNHLFPLDDDARLKSNDVQRWSSSYAREFSPSGQWYSGFSRPGKCHSI
ncbi:hypothetical protein FKM82_004965 [Ascaphus truei]